MLHMRMNRAVCDCRSALHKAARRGHAEVVQTLLDFGADNNHVDIWEACTLQCVIVFCSVLQCVAVCCSVLQCVAVRYMRVLQRVACVL